MYKFVIAIGAFHPALLLRNLQPYARVAQRAFAAITGNSPALHNLGFGGLDRHEYRLVTWLSCCVLWAIARAGARVRMRGLGLVVFNLAAQRFDFAALFFGVQPAPLTAGCGAGGD